MTKILGQMPCIVRPEHYELWLNPANTTPDTLAPALEPFPAGEMESHRVSRWANSTNTNDAAHSR